VTSAKSEMSASPESTVVEKSVDASVMVAIEGLGLGVFGVDRFYAGDIGLGVLKLLNAGGCGVWALVDYLIVMINAISTSSKTMFGKTISGDRNAARNVAVLFIVNLIILILLFVLVFVFGVGNER